jgi:hypothetical protein
LVDESIKRSREGLKAVGFSLAVLALAASAQLAIFFASGHKRFSPVSYTP